MDYTHFVFSVYKLLCLEFKTLETGNIFLFKTKGCHGNNKGGDFIMLQRLTEK